MSTGEIMATKNRALALATLFGGSNALARAIGVDKAITSRMVRAGKIPTHYNVRVINAAAAAKIDQREIVPLLDDHVCPCCNRPLDADQPLDLRRVARAKKK
jgi:hypothetical protein